MAYNWKARRRTIYNEFSDRGINVSVRYEHYSDWCPSYFVTVFGFTDMDEEEQDTVIDALDALEEQDFAVQYAEREGDVFELVEDGSY